VKQFEKLLKAKIRDFIVIKAHADGVKRLFAALEVYVHETKEAATVIVAIDLETLAVELVHEANGASLDYAYSAGWHGLLQRDRVIEIDGGKTITTAPKLRGDGKLTAIARTGTSTLVSGTNGSVLHKYPIDGFVAKVAKGELAMLMETSALGGNQGPLATVVVGASGTVYAAGGAMGDDRRYRLFSGVESFVGASVSTGEIYSLHELPDRTVMVGAREAAEIVRGGTAQTLSGVIGRIHGTTTFRGTEYWMGHDGADYITLFKRAGTKLSKKYRTKYHYVGYRSLEGAPEARMTATEDLLLVTNKERIHIYDGKKWTQLGIQPDVKKLAKRLPAAMK